jgi:hypothetical protein
MSNQIMKSLAGRVALLNLLPFQMQEVLPNVDITSWEELVVNGVYPRKYQFDIDTNDYFPHYIQTYIEHDLRQILNLMDLGNFQKSFQLLTGRAGQILNQSNCSIDLDINQKTANA